MSDKKRTIVHHTLFDFPLDKHFYGESIVIGSLLRGMRDQNTSIISSGDNLVSNEKNNDLASLIVKNQFNSELKQIKYEENPDKYLQFIESKVKQAGKNPVILNYHFPKKDLQVSKLAKNEFGERVKTVLHLHCMPELYDRNSHNFCEDKCLEELLDYGIIDKYVAVSNSVKTAFTYSKLLKQGQIAAVKNGIDSNLYDISQIQNLRQKVRNNVGINGDFVMGYVGRMNENKGVNSFLELMRIVDEKKISDISFLYGSSDGTEREEFLKNVNLFAPNLLKENRIKLGLDVSKLVGGDLYEKEVEDHFLRQLTQDNIVNSPIYGGISSIPLHYGMDVYVHPAKSEALGLSIIEGLALGIPAIGSDTGGISELINAGNGELVNLKGNLTTRHVNLSSGNRDPNSNYNAQVILQSILSVKDKIESNNYNPSKISSQVLFEGFNSKQMVKETLNVYDNL